MRNLIFGPVGRGEDNDPKDVRALRAALKALKGETFEPEDLSGFMDAELEADTRDFQRRHGLIEDARLTPGGETERNVVARILGDGLDRAKPEETTLRNSVGAGGANDGADVIALKRVLGTLDYLKYDRTKPPSPFIDTDTVEVIQRVQRENDLFEDGRADPGGETILTLRDLLEAQDRVGGQTETKVAFAPAIPLVELLLSGTAVGAMAVISAPNKDAPGESPDLVNPKLENIPPTLPETKSGEVPRPPEESDDHRPGSNDSPKPNQIPEMLPQKPTGFPIPPRPEDLIEIFPDDRGRFSNLYVIKRKGKEEIRQLNSEIAKCIVDTAKTMDISAIHDGGARDDKGNELKETYLPSKTGGRKGSNFLDVTIRVGKKLLHINTVDTRSDGMTLSTREDDQIWRVVQNKLDDHYAIAIPKLRPDETFDCEAFGEALRPILDEMDGRHPVSGKRLPAKDVFYHWKKMLKLVERPVD